MNKFDVLVESDNFSLITKKLKTDGEKCVLDKGITGYLRNTTKTDIGKKLGMSLSKICDSSEIHRNHASEPLPSALDKLMESIKNVDKCAKNDLKVK